MALSAALAGGWQEPDADGRAFCTSCFNLAWFGELGIEPRVIFDVGSFDGGDALRFRHAFPQAAVIAIDADPLRAERIMANTEGRGISVYGTALLDRIGTVELHHSCDRSELGSRCASIFKWGKKPKAALITVPCTTLQAICASIGLDSIDLLHIDIEGAELLAINGLGPIRPRLIWAEVWDGWEGAPGSVATHEGILALGYRQIAESKADRLYLHESLPCAS